MYKDKDGKYFATEEASWNDLAQCEFKTVFLNGELIREQSLSEIRARLHGQCLEYL